jgi:hypothetical protein
MYKMPLLNVVGIPPQNKSFFFCFVFLKEENEGHYGWALQNIPQLYDGVENPKVITTYREMALLNSLTVVFPVAKNLICIWHIEKNVLAKKSAFRIQRRIRWVHETLEDLCTQTGSH